jgi:hypothetical protein
MIQNDQVNAVEESTLEVDAADGVLANDTAPNGPLSLVEGLYRTTGGGQIYFFSDGSYDYVSAAGFSGTDTVQYTAFDSSNNVAGTATLTIDVAASAPLPFVSIGTQLGVRQVVTAGFPEVGSGLDTSAGTPVPLTGGGYVITVDYLDQANGTTVQVQTYDANNNLVGTFNPGVPVHNLLTTALTDGDYVVGWATGDSPTETSQVELFNAAGTVLAGPVTIDVPGGGVGISKIAALPGGGFVALELGDNGQQLYAWSFNAAGRPDSQPYAIGPAPLSTQKLAVLPDGEIVVAQIENSDEVEVQRYDTHGNPIGSEILPQSDGNVIDPASMSVTVMPNGGFAVSWESIISSSNPREELSHIQLVDANGNLVGNQAQTDFAYTTVFGAPLPRVTPLANGGFVVSWRGIINNGNTYDGVQVYNASGNAVGGLIEYSDISASGSTFARVFALPGGGFAVGLQGPDPADGNLLIYDNSGDYVGDVPMEYAGDGSDVSEMLLANQPDGNTLVLYNELNDTLMSSRATVQTLNLNNGLSTPSIQTGISFNENTTGTIPVVVSLPDPDGSEIVQWIDVVGVPSGWTLSDAGATLVFDGFEWKVIAGNVAHGGEIDLSLTPPANFVGTEALTVTAHVVDTGNGSQSQSIPVTFNVTVAAVTPEPGSTTADMIMRDGNNGNYEIFDLGDNAVLAAGPLGQVGTELQVAGLGGFFGTDTSDMILRDSNNGVFEIYDISNNTIAKTVNVGQVGLEWSVSGFGDFSSRSGETDMLMRNNGGNFEVFDISNNTITSATPMGQVGLEWSVAGFGDFSTRPNESDMLMRNNNTGVLELYDIINNQITSAAPVGQVGLEWSVAGFGDFSGNANETDMLMRNSNSGVFELYDIRNNQITSAAPMGQVGLEWSVVGFGPTNGAGTSDMLMRNTNTGAFELFDIGNNAITAATGMGQVGLEWSVAGIATAAPGAATAASTQLAQAMASYAPAGAALNASVPLGEITMPSPASLLAAQAPSPVVS